MPLALIYAFDFGIDLPTFTRDVHGVFFFFSFYLSWHLFFFKFLF